MKTRMLFLPAVLAGLLWSCNTEQVTDDGTANPETADPPVAPTEDVLIELKGQVIGGKLLGNTVMLSGDAFAASDLAKAPEYYLVYYSASW